MDMVANALGCCLMSTERRMMQRALPLRKKHIAFSFMLCVRPDDLWVTYMNCIHRDLQKTFLEQSQYMNGPLHICFQENENEESTCVCCKKHFAIRGVLAKHTLYALLPKEGIYVGVEAWQHEYMKSQMLELLYILRKLGAKSVNLKLEKKHAKSTDVDLQGNVAAPLAAALNVDLGISHNSLRTADNLIELDATYDDSGTPYTMMGDFGDDENIFYLNEMQDWQDIIIQRLECSVRALKFTFNFTNTIKIKNTFYTKVQSMGVKLSAAQEEQGSYYVSGAVQWSH